MVLIIENRTENWKTARCLSPFFGERAAALARRRALARRLGESLATPAADVTIELFWKGVRDWLARCTERKKERKAQLVRSYRKRFCNLRHEVQQYGCFRKLEPGNYEVLSADQEKQLVANLVNTEIDIVLETPTHLFIGEAKYKSGFHASGKLILVHQLVRQYVMAKVLVDVLPCHREVVPFVVTEGVQRQTRSDRNADEPGLRSRQVQFLIQRCWMQPCNCLTWDDLERLASKSHDSDAGRD